MIYKLKEWCEGLIIAIIISIIIEMLIPEGNNKKYAKVIIGIYILYVMINPVLDLLGEKIDINSIFSINVEETYVDIDKDIKDIYILGIEDSIKNELIEKGFDVKNVEIQLDSYYETINHIIIILNKSVENTNDIYEYLQDNYFVDEQNIELRGSQ